MRNIDAFLKGSYLTLFLTHQNIVLCQYCIVGYNRFNRIVNLLPNQV